MKTCPKCKSVLATDELCSNCWIVTHDDDKGRIAVDFDKTLAYHEHGDGHGPGDLGKPIPLMLARVKQWLHDGENVCIFTARADKSEQVQAIEKWCEKYIGQKLDVTNIKTPDMKRFYDDKAEHVEENRGVVEDDHRAVTNLDLHGVSIAIENPCGTMRTGSNSSGKQWSQLVKSDYGRIVGTKGADGDQLDCIIGPKGRTNKIFVINQVTPGTDKFDEHKIVFGADDKDEAKKAYLSNYPKDWDGFGSIVKMKEPEFHEWMMGDLSKPAKDDQDMKICKDCAMPANMDSTHCLICGGSGWVQPADPIAPLLQGKGSSQLITTIHNDPTTDSEVSLAYDRDWPAEKRHNLPKGQFGDPDKEAFPVSNQEDIDNSAKLLHHSKNPDKVKRRLTAIAHKMGLKVPETWGTKADDMADGDIGMGEFYCEHCKKAFGANADDAVGDWPCPECLLDAKRIRHSAVGNIKPKTATDNLEDDEFWCEIDDIQIITDGLEDGTLMKVRHLATIADSMNGNKRIYPRPVVQKSVERLRSRIRQGNKPYSEQRHPAVGRDGTQEKYFDNPERRTARIDDVEDVDPKGRVYITRSILATPHGHMIAAAYKSGTHKGVSNRWKMQGHYADVAGQKAHIADELDWHTTDDVENPAFPQTRNDYHLLTDEMRIEAGLPALDDNPSAAGTAKKGKKMNPQFTEAREKLFKLIRDKASKKKVDAAYLAMKDELLRAEGRGEALADMTSTLITDGFMVESYDPSRTGPTGTWSNMTGSENTPGYAGEMQNTAAAPSAAPEPTLSPGDDPAAKGKGDMTADAIAKVLGISVADMQAGLSAIKDAKTASDKAASDKLVAYEIKTAIDTMRVTVLDGVDPTIQEMIVNLVAKTATDAKSVPTIMATLKDEFGPVVARARLAGGGYNADTTLGGTTVTDPKAHRGVAVVNEGQPAYMAQVDMILAENDKYAKTLNKTFREDPNSSVVKSRRAYNRKNFIEPMLAELDAKKRASKDGAEWVARMDGACTADSQALSDSIDRAATDSNTTTLTNVFNQPVLLTALIIQQFQDMQSGAFVQGIGPGLSNGIDEPGWTLRGKMNDGRTGAVIRVPIESYTQPTGFGTSYGNLYDAGLLTPENYGIDIGTPNIVWLEYSAAFRRIAADISHDVIKMVGQGPLNWAAIARALFHITWDKSRRIDTACLNEIMLASDEYQNVAVASETPNLTVNSVYAATGGVTVNLNTAKYANAAVTTTDLGVTYGNSAQLGANGVVPVGAIRFQTNQGVTVTSSGGVNAGLYCGTSHGTTMILHPRVKNTLNALGQLSAVTQHAVKVTVPANSIEGTLDTFGNIQPTAVNQQNLQTPTFAIDYENGVILFAAGQVAGSSNVVTTAVNYSYYYVTNFTNFAVNNVTALGLLATGQTIQNYLSGFFETMDQQAALMGSLPRLVKPDMMFMSLNASANITPADIFYKLNSPDGTQLFPTEDFFMQRTGVMGARINAPWWGGDRRAMMFRGGSTKYAISDPWAVYGPYPKTDSVGRPIGGNLFYGEELSCIFTPLLTGQDGSTIIQPAASTIVLR